MVIWYSETGTEIKRFPSAMSVRIPESGRPVLALFNAAPASEFTSNRDCQRIAVIHLRWGQYVEVIHT